MIGSTKNNVDDVLYFLSHTYVYVHSQVCTRPQPMHKAANSSAYVTIVATARTTGPIFTDKSTFLPRTVCLLQDGRLGRLISLQHVMVVLLGFIVLI